MDTYLLANREHISRVYQPLKAIRGGYFHFIMDTLKNQVGDNTLESAFLWF